MLQKRDADLESLRNGDLVAKKKPINSQTVREEAWKKYLNLFYNRKPIASVESNDDDENDVDYKPQESRDRYNPERGNTGFFSIRSEVSDIKKLTAQLKQKDEDIETKGVTKVERSLSLETENESPHKVIARPLSVGLRPEFHNTSPYALLRRILSAPPKFRSSKHRSEVGEFRMAKAKKLKPICVSAAADFPSNAETLRNLNKNMTEDMDRRQKSFNERRKEQGMLPIAPDGYLPNSIVVALYKELKKEEEPTEEEEWKPKMLTQQQLDELEEYSKRVRIVFSFLNPLASSMSSRLYERDVLRNGSGEEIFLIAQKCLSIQNDQLDTSLPIKTD